VYPLWLQGAGFFCFGLILGSFLNVCIYRLPRGLSVVKPRSACPSCNAPIAAYDNIPVLSWIILGGRCRNCRESITPRYAVVELICGMLFLLSFLHAGSSGYAVKGCILSFLLLGLAFTDAETHLLPDAMTLPGLAAAVLLSLYVLVPGPAFQFFPIHFEGTPTRMQQEFQLSVRSLADSLLGAAVGSGVLYGIALVYRRLRHTEGMGLGDVKLMAMVGAFFGPMLTIFVLCASSLLGGLFGVWILVAVFWKRMARYQSRLGGRAAARSWQAAQVTMRSLEIPFGVFLCLTSVVAWFYGPMIVRAYLGMLGFRG
jgi:leader peptidase (prepilin peptidase)/N-methyltransferase